jgi:hypothetical protein
MRTDLDHLPPAKRRELERVAQALFEEFADATAIANSDWKKNARILKVILYGSYARGGWVDEPYRAPCRRLAQIAIVPPNHFRACITDWSTVNGGDPLLTRSVMAPCLTARRSRRCAHPNRRVLRKLCYSLVIDVELWQWIEAPANSLAPDRCLANNIVD